MKRKMRRLDGKKYEEVGMGRKMWWWDEKKEGELE